MIVSFDLDDTIIMPASQTDPDESFSATFGYSRFLRHGTISLFRKIVSDSIDLVVYTNSYRGRRDIQRWFENQEIRLSDVITQPIHDQAAERHWTGEGMPPLKYPPWFGIDLHIDDSPVVAHYGAEFGFRVLTVAPEDDSWDDLVWRTITEIIGGEQDEDDQAAAAVESKP